MSTSNTYAALDNLIAEINGVKKSAASPLSEAGQYGTTSKHPSVHAEDDLEMATTGSRAAENTADIKAMTFPTIDKGPEANQVNQEDHQFKGLGAAPTGEDPAVEDDYKDHKEDPGTTLPARVGEGPKYASYPMPKLASTVARLGNALLADVANGRFDAKSAAPVPKTAAAPAPEQTAIDDAALGLIFDVTKQASDSADLVIQWIDDSVKVAAGPPEEGPPADEDGPPMAGGDAMPPPSAGPMPGGPPPGAGGPPPGGPGGPGGDPLAAAGAAMPGGPDAGPSPHEAVAQLLAAIVEQGVSPDEICQIAQTLGHGDPGGPGGPGGPPPGPEMAEKMANFRKLAHAARVAGQWRAQHGFVWAPPKTAAEYQLRQTMHAYISEAIRSSRSSG